MVGTILGVKALGVGGLERAVGDWRPDLVNKRAENNFEHIEKRFLCRNCAEFMSNLQN